MLSKWGTFFDSILKRHLQLRSFPEEVHLSVIGNALPDVLPAHSVTASLRGAFSCELDQLVQLETTARPHEPTDWFSQIEDKIISCSGSDVLALSTTPLRDLSSLKQENLKAISRGISESMQWPAAKWKSATSSV